MTLKMKTSTHFSMGNRTLIHTDLLAMDVSWLPKDLELFENEFDFVVSMVCTIARCITFAMAIIVHRAFYRLVKRLPGRAINQVIYPHMVSKSVILNADFKRVLGGFSMDFRWILLRFYPDFRQSPTQFASTILVLKTWVGL